MTARLICGTLLALSLRAAAARSATCTVSTAGVAFGTYDPTLSTADTMIGTASLNCTYLLTGVSATLSLAAGNSGTFANRTMLQGTQTLTYNLYLDAAHTQIFGDGMSGTDTFTGCYVGLAVSCPGGGDTSGMTYAVLVYGLLPARQDIGAGIYGDTLVLTVTY